MHDKILSDIIEALTKALRISKYITNKDEKYRKHKKCVKKMLKNITHGEITKYVDIDESGY